MDTLEPAAQGRNPVSGVGVLDRAMTLVGLLGDGPRSLRSLALASGLPRPTAHRLLVALEVHGLVGRTPDGAFRLGPRLTELALRAGHGLELGTLAAGVLTRLHDQTGESAQLYVRSGDRRLCVAARDAGAGLRDSVPVGALLPLDAGSGGKVLLAWSDDAGRFPAADPPAWPRRAAAAGRRAWPSARPAWPASARPCWPTGCCSARCACRGRRAGWAVRRGPGWRRWWWTPRGNWPRWPAGAPRTAGPVPASGGRLGPIPAC